MAEIKKKVKRRPGRKIPDKEKTKTVFIEALKGNLGFLTYAAKSAGICYDTYRKWYATDEKFKAEVDSTLFEANEKSADLAESKLMQAINKGELSGIIFYLKTKGHKRGYIEKREYASDVNLKHHLDIDEQRHKLRNLTADELKTLMQLTSKIHGQ